LLGQRRTLAGVFTFLAAAGLWLLPWNALRDSSDGLRTGLLLGWSSRGLVD
jgi:hypothetical protein